MPDFSPDPEQKRRDRSLRPIRFCIIELTAAVHLSDPVHDFSQSQIRLRLQKNLWL